MTHPGLVLMVEDDADIREDVSELLREEGYQVVTASNGAEALCVLRSLGRRPCIVLLDLMMPVMDGWTAHAEIARDPSLRDLPVVIVSGASDVPTHARNLGAVGYLTKPFAWDALLGTVRAHC
jgi:CheY-like chemotaxis protein